MIIEMPIVVVVISKYHPFKEGYARFTTVPF